MSYKKKLILLISGFILLKIILSAFLELGNDEVYYITYAKDLRLNYFDHPPIVAYILKVFSLNLHLKSEIFLRIGYVFCGAISCFLIYKIVQKIYTEHAAFIAALLFTASIYGNIISGMMIMPDAPMLMFWLLSLYICINIVYEQNNSKIGRLLLLFGTASGLAIMSKASAGMLWAGLALYAVFFNNKLLKNPYFYLALLISVFIASPLIFESYFGNNSGFDYHAGRVKINSETPLQFNSFLRQALGEFAYNNPINYILSFAGIFYTYKRKVIPKNIFFLLLFFSLPLIFLVWALSLFRDTLPHWTGPSYIVLIVFASIYLASKMKSTNMRKPPIILLFANALVVFALMMITTAAHFLPYSFNEKDSLKIGKNDLLLDFSGWKKFSTAFNDIYKKDAASGIMKPNSFLISDYWFPAAHIDWYVASPYNFPFVAVGNETAIHEYARLNKKRQGLTIGDDAYYISVSNYFSKPDSVLMSYFSAIEPLQYISQIRAGKEVRRFYIIRMHNYVGGLGNNGIPGK